MNSQKIQEELLRCGFGEKEVLIYVYLLKQGVSYPSKIASDLKIDRTTVYKVALRMAVKGLVSEIRQGKKLMLCAESPRSLMRAAKWEANIANENVERIQTLLPFLQAVQFEKDDIDVRFYKGVDAVTQLYFSHLEEQNYEMLAYAGVTSVKSFIPYKKWRQYIRAKQDQNITLRALVAEEEYIQDFSQEMFKGIQKKYWPRMKMIPKELFNEPVEITLFGKDKMSFVVFDADRPVGVLIQHKALFKTLQSMFEMAWISGKEV